MADLSPPEMASKLLADAKGIARNAEAKAWEHAYRYQPDNDGRRYWVQVVTALVDKTEYPPVQRREWAPPTPAQPDPVVP